jgi:serine/threonine protein kinase
MLGLSHHNGARVLLMEYCAHGDLAHFLRKMAKARNPIPVLERLAYAVQAAAGLAYLHDQRIVHRDIAARNVLLDGPADLADPRSRPLVAKVERVRSTVAHPSFCFMA